MTAAGVDVAGTPPALGRWAVLPRLAEPRLPDGVPVPSLGLGMLATGPVPGCVQAEDQSVAGCLFGRPLWG